MINYTLVAFSIMHLCLFLGAWLVFGAQMRAGIAAYRAYILSSQFVLGVAALLGIRYLIGLLYL